MKPLLCFIVLALSLSACSSYPTPYRHQNGKVAYARQWGGKWMHTINADGSMAFTGDNEISFQHGAQAVTTIAGAWFNALVQLEKELTAQLANANLTSLERARIQAQLVEVQAKIAAGLKGQGIDAGAPLGPVNFE